MPYIGREPHPMTGDVDVGYIRWKLSVKPLLNKQWGTPEAMVCLGSQTIGLIKWGLTFGGPMWYFDMGGNLEPVGRTPEEAAREVARIRGYLE